MNAILFGVAQGKNMAVEAMTPATFRATWARSYYPGAISQALSAERTKLLSSSAGDEVRATIARLEDAQRVFPLPRRNARRRTSKAPRAETPPYAAAADQRSVRLALDPDQLEALTVPLKGIAQALRPDAPTAKPLVRIEFLSMRDRRVKFGDTTVVLSAGHFEVLELLGRHLTLHGPTAECCLPEGVDAAKRFRTRLSEMRSPESSKIKADLKAALACLPKFLHPKEVRFADDVAVIVTFPSD